MCNIMIYYDMDGQVSTSNALISETCSEPLSGNMLRQKDCK